MTDIDASTPTSGRGVVELLVPGFAALGPSAADDSALLCRALAQADRRPVKTNDPDALAASLFALEPAPMQDLPVAALTRLAELGAEPDDLWWLRADPVHLEPDRDRLVMFDPSVLAVRAEEANALVDLLRDLLPDPAWRLEFDAPSRWYLGLPEDPGVRTQAPRAAVGRAIDAYLPEGSQARRWRQLMNEMQMVLYTAAVNQVREARGAPTINSVWFWGAGRLPVVPRRFDCVLTELLMVQGMAKRAGIAYSAPQAPGAVAFGGRRTLVALDLDPSSSGRAAALSRLNAWVAALIDALRVGDVTALHVYPGDGHAYELRRIHRWRFWRRHWRSGG